MCKRIALIFLILAFNSQASSRLKYEKQYIKQYCWGEAEYRISGGRVDCLTESYAIEFEWSDKVHLPGEGIEQALRYAKQTKKKPGIVMFCRRKKASTCEKHYRRAAQIGADKITFWLIKDSQLSLLDARALKP